mmetsp:Transcript_25554/g.39286  ORF Transcript_25554/g.39286 Transcript_25554/m.39286 type:complete len:283 (+) Transcript_25554:88-936(+)
MSTEEIKKTTRVAFVGNSIIYFNDCPRFFQNMVNDSGGNVLQQDSCLKGGATLKSLWTDGNGMDNKFGISPNAKDETTGIYDVGSPTVQELLSSQKWDYVVINDYTQQPARDASRQESLEILKEKYCSVIRDSGAIPILLQTAAYRYENIKNTEDLGSASNFTKLLQEGLELYMDMMQNELPKDQKPCMAPMGNAYLHIHDQNMELWETLFCADNFHPTPSGTWLEACVLYCTIFACAPPKYNPKWWNNQRYQNMDDPHPPKPTEENAEKIRKYVMEAMNVM